MVTCTAPDTEHQSLDQAIAYGLTHGSTARQRHIYPEIYAESLKTLIEGWIGSKPEWIKAGEAAAWSAYLGEQYQAA